MRPSWLNFTTELLNPRSNISLDDALARYKAIDCPGQPALMFETEADALAFELIWG